MFVSGRGIVAYGTSYVPSGKVLLTGTSFGITYTAYGASGVIHVSGTSLTGWSMSYVGSGIITIGGQIVIAFATSFEMVGGAIIGVNAVVVINWLTSWNATGSIIVGFVAGAIISFGTGYTASGKVRVSGTSCTRFSVANYFTSGGFHVAGTIIIVAVRYQERMVGGFRISGSSKCFPAHLDIPVGIIYVGRLCDVFYIVKAYFVEDIYLDVFMSEIVGNSLVIEDKHTLLVNGLQVSGTDKAAWPYFNVKRFIHRLETIANTGTTSGAVAAWWALSNSVDSLYNWEQNNSNSVALGWNSGNIFLKNYITGETATIPGNLDTNYTIVIKRVYDKLSVRVLIGNTLVGILSVNIGLTNYSVLFAVNSYGHGS